MKTHGVCELEETLTFFDFAFSLIFSPIAFTCAFYLCHHIALSSSAVVNNI